MEKNEVGDGFLSDEEEFVGEGEVDIIETSAAKTGTALNRLITDDDDDKDLFDTLFQMIENDAYGRVQVSKLIEFLKDIISTGDFDELEMMLDPMGCDMHIDLETFRSAINVWEEKQKNQDFYPQSSTPINSSQHLSYKFNDSFDLDELNSFHTLNSLGKGDTMDPEKMESEISQLKFQNTNLRKQVDTLENQLISLEENYNSLKNEQDNARMKIQSLQNQNQELQSDLHLQIVKIQEEKEKLASAKEQLTNEKNDLDRQYKNVKDELHETLDELTNLRSSEQVYHQRSLEQEASIIVSKNEKATAEELLTRKIAECEGFKERVLEVLRNNERLRLNKRDLEQEILNLLEQLCLNRVNKEILEHNMHDDDDGFFSENVALDVTLDNANIISTPLCRQSSSIYNELMDLNIEASSSQPICGKSPDFADDLTFSWNVLENIQFMLQQIWSQLAEVNATELIEKYSFTNESGEINDRIKSSGKCTGKVDFEENGVDIISKLETQYNISEASPTSLSPGKLRDQINNQLRILRLQIAKSQTILTNLQSKSLAHVSKSTLNSPVQPESDLSFSQVSLQHQSRVLNRTFGQSDSQSSTPLHHRIRTRSCPILPSETTFVTKGTQTEPIDSTLNTNLRLDSTVKDISCATPAISITSDVDQDMSDVPLSRARTSSYSEAIKLGNLSSDDNDDETRLTHLRQLCVLPEEEHEDSDQGLSPKVNPPPRLPPPYRPPPPPRPYRSAECLSYPLYAIRSQNPSKSLDVLTLTYPSHLQTPQTPSSSQRLRPILPIIRQSSDPFPAHGQPQPFPTFPAPLMPTVYHSLSAQGLNYNDPWLYADSQSHLYRSPIQLTPSPTPCASDKQEGDDIKTSRSHEEILVETHPDENQNNPLVTVQSDDNDENVNKKYQINRLGSRRKKRTLGSTSNNNPSIQRVKAIDVEEEIDQISAKDDSDVDVKSDILHGMNRANRRATSPSGTSTEITVSSSSKSFVSVDTCEAKTLRRKSGESSKNRLLMPELMENSETESAKNSGESMESETEQPGGTVSVVDVLTPPPPFGDGPFPSLPDSFLKALELHKTCERSDRLNEKDVEAKFQSLLLAFKTDTFTLSNRLELHHRQRDIAEKNIEEEIVAIKENLNTLNQICADEDSREIVKRLHHHLEVLHQSTARMSSRAEVYGAVQQEDRINRAIEVMLIHAENLKRTQEKAATDLEEMRKMLAENNLLSEDGSETEDVRRNLRSYSVTSTSVGRQASKRRASIAALPRSTSERLDGRTKFINFVNTSRNSVCSIGSRHCSLYSYNLKQVSSDNVSQVEKLVKRHAGDDSLVPSSSSVELSDDEIAGQQRRSSKKESIKSNNICQHNQHKMSTSEVEILNNNDKNIVSGEMEADSTKNTPYLHEPEHNSHSVHCTANWPSPVTSEYHTDPSDNDDVADAPTIYSDRTRTIVMDTASNLLSLTTWVDQDHLFHGVRYTVGGLLFVAAFISLLVAFLPGSTSALTSCGQRMSWTSFEEVLNGIIDRHVQLQGKPPA